MKYSIAAIWSRMPGAATRKRRVAPALPPAIERQAEMEARVQAWETEGGKVLAPVPPPAPQPAAST